MGTNAYEVIVGIRGRVPRLFVQGGVIVAARISSDAATSTPLDIDSARG
jgi:hypothetical protein